MRKHISIQSTVYPPGWVNPSTIAPKQAVKAYNRHMRHLQRELDKMFNTDKASKYFI